MKNYKYCKAVSHSEYYDYRNENKVYYVLASREYEVLLSALSENGIMYRSEYNSGLDRCFHIQIFGSYSKYDVDGDVVRSTLAQRVFGTVCKDLSTGTRIYEFDRWTTLRMQRLRSSIYYDREPHDWVRYLRYDERLSYCDCMQSNYSMEDLYTKFIHLVPKDCLRDIRLSELGIE